MRDRDRIRKIQTIFERLGRSDQREVKHHPKKIDHDERREGKHHPKKITATGSAERAVARIKL